MVARRWPSGGVLRRGCAAGGVVAGRVFSVAVRWLRIGRPRVALRGPSVRVSCGAAGSSLWRPRSCVLQRASLVGSARRLLVRPGACRADRAAVGVGALPRSSSASVGPRRGCVRSRALRRPGVAGAWAFCCAACLPCAGGAWAARAPVRRLCRVRASWRWRVRPRGGAASRPVRGPVLVALAGVRRWGAALSSRVFAGRRRRGGVSVRGARGRAAVSRVLAGLWWLRCAGCPAGTGAAGSALSSARWWRWCAVAGPVALVPARALVLRGGVRVRSRVFLRGRAAGSCGRPSSGARRWAVCPSSRRVAFGAPGGGSRPACWPARLCPWGLPVGVVGGPRACSSVVRARRLLCSRPAGPCCWVLLPGAPLVPVLGCACVCCSPLVGARWRLACAPGSAWCLGAARAGWCGGWCSTRGPRGVRSVAGGCLPVRVLLLGCWPGVSAVARASVGAWGLVWRWGVVLAARRVSVVSCAWAARSSCARLARSCAGWGRVSRSGPCGGGPCVCVSGGPSVVVARAFVAGACRAVAPRSWSACRACAVSRGGPQLGRRLARARPRWSRSVAFPRGGSCALGRVAAFRSPCPRGVCPCVRRLSWPRVAVRRLVFPRSSGALSRSLWSAVRRVPWAPCLGALGGAVSACACAPCPGCVSAPRRERAVGLRLPRAARFGCVLRGAPGAALSSGRVACRALCPCCRCARASRSCRGGGWRCGRVWLAPGAVVGVFSSVAVNVSTIRHSNLSSNHIYVHYAIKHYIITFITLYYAPKAQSICS